VIQIPQHGRFVSIYTKFSHGVRDAEVEHYATGKQKVLVDALEAQFGPNGVTEEDHEQAVKSLHFPGLPEDRETEGLVDPRSRLGVWDSEAAQKAFRWTDSDTDLVLKELRESDQNIANGGNVFLEIEVAKMPAPWSSYDRLEDANRIAELAIETETDLLEVIAYEKENRNRPEVISALAELLDSVESEPAIEKVRVEV
jgi:hypothetical protein